MKSMPVLLLVTESLIRSETTHGVRTRGVAHRKLDDDKTSATTLPAIPNLHIAAPFKRFDPATVTTVPPPIIPMLGFTLWVTISRTME
jgi:hypothetical protein